MKTVRRRSLFASLLSVFVLLLQFSPVLADGKARSARPFEVDFDKCFDRQGDAPVPVYVLRHGVGRCLRDS